MEKRTKQLIIGGIVMIAALVILFSFIKNYSDWRTGDWQGSGTNWIGLNWGKLGN